ncbi:hypothetical protein [Parendozoicomonas sp. Alg238-R29]|uniref:hypothetical protein n=1 Tax=Parendozoicomonas sp. Alg238-R29 TaxID=2993446 RepID=UPI00248E8217|nr:hypothetical protein [Parendozoicomonas sp. Alg238-R29]
MNVIPTFTMLCMVILFSAGCTARFDKPEPSVFIVKQKTTPAGTRYTVQAPTCTPYNLNPRQPVQLDCYVESARQQSLVHPERAHRVLEKQE